MNNTVQHPNTIRQWLQTALATEPFLYTNGTAMYRLPGRSDVLLRVGAGERDGKFKAVINDKEGQYICQHVPDNARYLRPVTGAADQIDGGETLYRIASPSDFHHHSQSTQEFNFSLVRYAKGEHFEALRKRLVPDEDDEFAQLELLEKISQIPPEIWATLFKDIKLLYAAGYDYEVRGKNIHCIWPEDGDPGKVSFTTLDYGTDCNPRWQKKNNHMSDSTPEKIGQSIVESVMEFGDLSFEFSSVYTRYQIEDGVKRMEAASRNLRDNLAMAAQQVGYPTNLQELNALHGSEWSLRSEKGTKPAQKYIPTYRPLLLDAPHSLDALNLTLDQRMALPRGASAGQSM